MQATQKTILQYDLRRLNTRQPVEDEAANIAAPPTLGLQMETSGELANIKTLLQDIASDMSGLKAGMDAVQTTVEKLGT